VVEAGKQVDRLQSSASASVNLNTTALERLINGIYLEETHTRRYNA
jgi:hypothetical protein